MKYTITPVVCGAYQENAYLLCPENSAGCILVDPGDDLSALESAIARAGRTLAGILLTHGHFDHILAAQPLQVSAGAPVYVHAGDLEMLNDERLNSYNRMVSRLPSPNGLKAETIVDKIEVAGIQFEILHTPGHTPGSVCFYDAENAVLFSGDTLFCCGFGRMDLPGGSPAQMRASLRMLFELPGETRVLSGHGDETTIAIERSRYRL